MVIAVPQQFKNEGYWGYMRTMERTMETLLYYNGVYFGVIWEYSANFPSQIRDLSFDQLPLAAQLIPEQKQHQKKNALALPGSTEPQRPLINRLPPFEGLYIRIPCLIPIKGRRVYQLGV